MEINANAPTLLDKEYYTDIEYLSTSRFKQYNVCALRQKMIDLGFWEDSKKSEAFLVGNYVHSYFENKVVHEQFLEENEKYIFSRGRKKASFISADKMIKSLEEDPLFNRMYHGENHDVVQKELILTDNLGGIPFKGKVDTVNLSAGYFMDLKTMGSIQKKVYSPTLKKYTNQVIYNFVEYEYTLQFYIYQTLLEQKFGIKFTPYMVAVSKESTPDKEIILIDDFFLEMGKKIFEDNISSVKKILSGEVFPTGCGKCDYCLAKKKINKVVALSDYMEEK